MPRVLVRRRSLLRSHAERRCGRSRFRRTRGDVMRLNSPPVGRTVHIWRIDLTDVRWDDGEDTISSDELQAGYRRSDIVLRRRYWRCRSAVRLLLASYSQRSAQQLRFTHGEFGKPELVGVPWRFNVSHSGDSALLAVARFRSASTSRISITYA